MELLKIKNLSFEYPAGNDGRRFALSGIDLTIKSGEIVLLYGASGSGKSTLLRLLKPELAPFGEKSGEIYFRSQKLGEISPRVTASAIGYSSQSAESAVTETVGAELAFLLQNLAVKPEEIRRRIAEISAFFGLEAIIGRRIEELSSGQKRLVDLAAVMIGEPDLLLLDEPCGELDPVSSEQLWRTALRIRDELGTAIIVCEHSAERILPDCAKVLYLENGAQKFFLPPEQAAAELNGSELFGGFPCAARLSAAVGYPMTTAAQAMRFVRSEYSPVPPQNAGYDILKPDKTRSAVYAENVSFAFDRRGKNIADRLCFSAEYGEITALCGANGSGKTTLLRLIAGAYQAKEGKIYIDGKRITSYKGGSLYRGVLAMLPQDPRDIMIERTVYDDLLRTPDGEKRADEEIFSAADRLGLKRELLRSHPFDLSGGELMRAALAKLIFLKPKILLLDEPTRGLDAQCKRALSELFKKLAEDGACIIFVTHDLDFAAETADKTALLFGGEIAAHEPTEKFMSDNFLYTTAAARIGRGVFPNAVTTDKLIRACVDAESEANA